MTKRRLCIWGLLFSLVSAFAFADLPSALPAPSASSNFAGAGSSQIHPSSFLSNFVDLNLTDHHGSEFDVHALQGKTVLFNFIFTNCGSICPMQTKVLVDVLGALPMEVRSQVRFVSISIDPENDTPEKMLAFSQALKADVENWRFLTGNAQQIETLTERLLIFNEGEENKPQVHRTSLWLVDKHGRMMQRYRGDPPDKDRLIRELKQISQLH